MQVKACSPALLCGGKWGDVCGVLRQSSCPVHPLMWFFFFFFLIEYFAVHVKLLEVTPVWITGRSLEMSVCLSGSCHLQLGEGIYSISAGNSSVGAPWEHFWCSGWWLTEVMSSTAAPQHHEELC